MRRDLRGDTGVVDEKIDRCAIRECFHGLGDRGPSFDGPDVAAGVANADALGPKLGQGFDDGFLGPHSVNNEIPFLGGELLGDAKADAA